MKIEKKILVIFNSIIFLTAFVFMTNCVENDYSDNDQTNDDNADSEPPIENVVDYATVFEKLKKGINQDVSMPGGGPWIKVQHERAHMQTIKEAGFESVRIFMPYNSNIQEYEDRIQDALDYDLAVVICLWGH